MIYKLVAIASYVHRVTADVKVFTLNHHTYNLYASKFINYHDQHNQDFYWNFDTAQETKAIASFVFQTTTVQGNALAIDIVISMEDDTIASLWIKYL